MNVKRSSAIYRVGRAKGFTYCMRCNLEFSGSLSQHATAHPERHGRVPKTHPECAYCGCGGDGVHICGVCAQSGVDGPVIRGTGGRLS